jgi:hypothetical protein
MALREALHWDLVGKLEVKKWEGAGDVGQSPNRHSVYSEVCDKQYKFSAYKRKLKAIISGIYHYGFSQILICTPKQANNGP